LEFSPADDIVAAARNNKDFTTSRWQLALRVVSLRRSDTSGIRAEADTPGTSLNQPE